MLGDTTAGQSSVTAKQRCTQDDDQPRAHAVSTGKAPPFIVAAPRATCPVAKSKRRVRKSLKIFVGDEKQTGCKREKRRVRV